MPKHRVIRKHLDPARPIQPGLGLKIDADGAKAKDLVRAIALCLPISDARGHPPAQEFRVTLNIGGDVEQLLGTIGQLPLNCFT